VIGLEPRRRPRRVPTALVVLVVLIAIVAVGLNNVTEQRELDRLLARVASAQEAIAYSNRRVAATVDYTQPLLFGASVPARVRAGLQQLVADSAAGQVAGIRQERDAAARVAVVPWHRTMRAARAALVAYLDARVAYLRSITTDRHFLYVEHPELDRLLDDTRVAFRRAAGSGERDRIDAAFAGGTHPA
jgi:hypothetical protein